MGLNLPNSITENKLENQTITEAGISCDNWKFSIYARTNYQKEHRWPFQCFFGGNVAYPREAIEVAGDYDETLKIVTNVLHKHNY